MTMQTNAKSKAMMLFSQLSNINFGYTAVSEQDLVDNFNRILEDQGDNVLVQKIKELWPCNWEMAYGPALNSSGKEGKYHADNSLYVVKGVDPSDEDKNVYVVAIAGTNALSVFEQFQEDIKVKNKVAWLPGKSEYGHLSEGSHVGFVTIFDQPFQHINAEQKELTLRNFFRIEVEKNIAEGKKMEIITCGHSLGGALSPLVALGLKETHHEIPVSTYPTAGPTSGDATFAQYLELILGKENYHSIINSNDIVPMAWAKESLSQIQNVYTDKNIEPSLSLKRLLKHFQTETADNDYTRIAKDTEQIFAGKLVDYDYLVLHNGECGITLYDKGLEKDREFMSEALYQHLHVYATEGFGFTEDFACSVNSFMKSGRKELLLAEPSIADAKDAVNKAKKAAQDAQEYIDKANKIAKSGGTLTDIQALATKLDGIGNVATVLGVVGAGMELAVFLSGQPSAQQVMINMLAQISQQIQDLQNRMDVQFKKVITHQEFSEANTRRSKASTQLKTYFNLFSNYNSFIADNPDPEQYNKEQEKEFNMVRDLLKNIDPNDILLQVNELLTVVEGDGSTMKSIFDLAIEYYYANTNIIMELGNSIVNHVIAATQLASVVNSLNAGQSLDKDEFARVNGSVIKRLYQPLISSIITRFQTAISECTSTANQINTYAKDFITNELVPALSGKSLDSSAKYIGEALAQQWFWYDWAVVTIEEKENYFYAGASFSITATVDNKKIKIIVSKIDRESPNKLSEYGPAFLAATMKDASPGFFHPNSISSEFSQNDFAKYTDQFQDAGNSKYAFLFLHDDGNFFGYVGKDQSTLYYVFGFNTEKAGYGLYGGSGNRCYGRASERSYLLQRTNTYVRTFCNGVLQA